MFPPQWWDDPQAKVSARQPVLELEHSMQARHRNGMCWECCREVVTLYGPSNSSPTKIRSCPATEELAHLLGLAAPQAHFGLQPGLWDLTLPLLKPGTRGLCFWGVKAYLGSTLSKTGCFSHQDLQQHITPKTISSILVWTYLMLPKTLQSLLMQNLLVDDCRIFIIIF